MKKILFVAPYNLNVRSGGGLAALAYYNALESLFPGMVDIVCPSEACYGAFSTAIGAPKRTPLQRINPSPHRYKTFIKKYLKRASSEYGLCVVNGGIYAGDMMDIIHASGLRILVIHHNCEREYHMDNKSALTLRGRTPVLVNLLEKNAYKKADLNCFLTGADIALFRDYYGTAGSDPFLLGVFEPEPAEGHVSLEGPEGPHPLTIAITGSLCTVQTRAGIKDFMDHYYDLAMQTAPDSRIVLAGRDPAEEVLGLAQKYGNISVVPNPKDMSEIVRQADIFLCPTQVGGGLKLRVMDGMRQGLPVLVHKVSARGYEQFAGQPFFQVYSDGASFKKGLETILTAGASYDRAFIRNQYLDNFSFSSGRARMSEAVKRVMGL